MWSGDLPFARGIEAKDEVCRPRHRRLHVYESSYMDNHFLILLMPSLFEYENFEMWFPGSIWSDALSQRPVIVEEYEGFKGRKNMLRMKIIWKHQKI